MFFGANLLWLVAFTPHVPVEPTDPRHNRGVRAVVIDSNKSKSNVCRSILFCQPPKNSWLLSKTDRATYDARADIGVPPTGYRIVLSMDASP